MIKKITTLLFLSLSQYSFASDEVPEFSEHKNNVKNEIETRLKFEESANKNPFSLTAHKMNYILPYTYAENINSSVYDNIPNSTISDAFKHEEAKFQISLKVPVYNSIFFDDDKIYFGMTLKSFWQVYAEGASRPFRNTDYNPEIFYAATLPEFKGQSSYLMVGLEHESNGQIQYLSRSWNRTYVTIGTEHDNYAIGLKTWYRIPENKKEFEFDPSGDDNPDILDYYGHFELTGIYKYNDFHYSALARHNFNTGKGYLELGLTFPLYQNVKGYVQLVNGYGESLIDYNHYQRRIGIGIAVSDLL